jgi:hypothetical protein
MKYICPICNEIMNLQYAHILMCINNICSAMYFLPIRNRIKFKEAFVYKGKILCRGSFEYCQKICKLKAFL